MNERLVVFICIFFFARFGRWVNGIATNCHENGNIMGESVRGGEVIHRNVEQCFYTNLILHNNYFLPNFFR